jgi:hypothetical protein
MAVLPDKILTDREISDFIDRVNQRSDEILGENKFKIPDPSLPGLGLLIKLQIRAFEKSIASFLAPVFLGKSLITKARQSARFFRTLRDGFNDIKKIFTNPIQFILDEGINSVLALFPFPIAILFSGSARNAQRLKSLVDGASSTSGDSQLNEYDYDLVLNSNLIPEPGQLSTPSSKISEIKSVRVNYQTKTPGEKSPVNFLVPGDFFYLSDDSGNFTFSVSQVTNSNTFSEIFLQLKSQDSLSSSSKQVFSPGFSQKSVRLSRRITLREFLTADGKLVLPFSVLGVNLPLLSQLSFEIGDFSRLKDDNPVKQLVTQLEANSGLRFNQILAGMLDGVFPAVNWESIQNPSSGDYKKQLATEELISLSRLLQIGIDNPFFLIKILLNYIKLILLPLQVVLGVIKGLASKITGPFSIIRFVFQIISNPLKALCELISTAFLEFLRPYVEPATSAIIPWNELIQDPNDKGRGLKPLFSDLICGNFEKKLKNYTPNPNFFRTQSDALNTPSTSGPQIELPFDLSSNSIPGPGELVTNSQDPKSTSLIKISTLTNTVEDGLPYLASLNAGHTLSFNQNDTIQNYLVSSKVFRTDPAGNYFEFLVQPISQTKATALQNTQNDRTVSSAFKASLTINNPNKSFLFIVEKYLPVKAIAVWESVKGILSITISLAAEMPSLVPAVFRSLFSDGGTKTQSQVLQDSIIDVISPLYEGDPNILDGSAGRSLSRRLSVEEKVEIIQGSRETLDAIIGNDPEQNYEGIDTVFLNLQTEREAEGKNIYVIKSRIPDADERSKFRFNELAISNVGIRLKVLLQIYQVTSGLDGGLADKNIQISVYGFNGTNSFQIYSGDLYKAFLDYRIIETTPRGTQNRFNVDSMRDVIIENTGYVGVYLLPTLN